MKDTLRPGYKQTEVGVIPEDWGLPLLDSIAKRGSGHTPDKKHPEYWNGPIKWVSLRDSDALDNMFIEETAATITAAGIANSSAVIRPAGTVVLSRDAGVGKSAIIKTEMAVSQHFMAWQCGANLDNIYLYYWLQAAKPEFERIAMGNTIKTIGLPFFRNLRIAQPPVPEQRAIAAALSDVDDLLAKLDQLIAKKRDLKHAAMQQFLTGQTRLPGFSGAWEVKRLGEIGEISGAGVDKKISPNEPPVRLLNYLDVYKKDFLRSGDFSHEVTAKPDQVRRCSVQRGDVFFTPTSEVRDDIGHSAIAVEDIPDVVYSYHVVRLRLYESWDVLYRAYAFKHKDFMNQASAQCEGSGTRYVITLPKFRTITVRFPVDVAEQTAIATVLSDMDAEIAAFEARRDKTRALKQGMMHELLTGQIRLV